MMRHTLPARRDHQIRQIEFRGLRYLIGFSRFRDGALAEVFIDAKKVGTHAADDARDIAVLISIACQHGVPTQTMRDALTKLADGSPAGIGGAALEAIEAEDAAPCK